MQLKELFDFYRSVYLPIYAEVVAKRAKKPRQAAQEIEAAFSHLAVAETAGSDEVLRVSNVKQAANHVYRATLDAQKILWLTLRQELTDWHVDGSLLHASNASVDEVYTLYQAALDLATEARKQEHQNVGASLVKTIELYQGAIEKARDLYRHVDPIKVANLKKLQKKIMWKELAIAFVVGGFASLAASYAYTALTTPAIDCLKECGKTADPKK